MARPNKRGGTVDGHAVSALCGALAALGRALETKQIVNGDVLARGVGDGDRERASGLPVADDDLADVARGGFDAEARHRVSEGAFGDLVAIEVGFKRVSHIL